MVPIDLNDDNSVLEVLLEFALHVWKAVRFKTSILWILFHLVDQIIYGSLFIIFFFKGLRFQGVLRPATYTGCLAFCSSTIL